MEKTELKAMKKSRSATRAARQKGAEVVEFGFVLIPMLGFLFLNIDIAWAIFARSTLQYAVREGCRYAITSQTNTTQKDPQGNTLGQVDSIKYVVQQNALGFLGSSMSDSKWSLIQVNFYAPTDMSTVLAPPSSSSSPKPNVGGNIVEVGIAGYQLVPLAPLLRNHTPLSFNAWSADRMEASPGGVAPNYFNSNKGY